MRVTSYDGGYPSEFGPGADLLGFNVGGREHLFKSDTNLPVSLGTDPDQFLNLRRRASRWFFDPSMGARSQAIGSESRIARTTGFIDVSDDKNDIQFFAFQHLTVIRVEAVGAEEFGASRSAGEVQVTYAFRSTGAY